MKIVGFVLFLFGVTLAGGYAAAIPPRADVSEDAPPLTATQRITAWWDVGGPPFLGGMALMIVGAVLARRARRPEPEASADSPYRDGPSSSATSEMLSEIADELGKLPDSFTSKDDDAQAVLDNLLEERIPQFLDRREAMIEKMGLEDFATMIGQFAMMERGIARAWSAMTDECYAEVGPSLDRAKTALSAARRAL